MINVLLVDLGTPRDEISEPLGIETLAPYVEEEFPNEVSLELRSLELDNQPSIDEYIKQKFFSVIGLSTKIRAYNRFRQSMEIIQRKTPESIVVIGDILGTYAFEEVLSRYPNVICVRGEGENAFREIIKSVLNSGIEELSLNHIPNLACISEGQLRLTKREMFDLTKAKHPHRVLAPEVFKQHGIGRLEASRGCAYSMCDFCGNIEKYNGPGWRPFPLNFVVEELITLSKIGFKSPYFTDEDFLGDDIDRAYELADKIDKAKKEGLVNPELDFYINLRVNSVLGIGIGGKQEALKLLRRLKEIGLREIFIGVESGCKDQLMKRYKKGVTKENNIEAIKILRHLGIEIDLGFIFFDQESTLVELRENLNFISKAGLVRQDAQLIKKIRVEPRTPLGFRFAKEHPNVKIDLNLVEFPYQFKESEVGTIYGIFTTWQKEDLDVIYNLQSFCRGEIPEGYTRKEIKDVISRYRELDVRYLAEIVKIFESNITNREKRAKEITQKFQEIRKKLDSTLIDRVQWLDSKFRRFKV